jgi:hypothetical protein
MHGSLGSDQENIDYQRTFVSVTSNINGDDVVISSNLSPEAQLAESK